MFTQRSAPFFRATGLAVLVAACVAVQAQEDLSGLMGSGQFARALQLAEEQSTRNPRDVRLAAQYAMLLSINKRDMQALRVVDGLAARHADLPQLPHLSALIYLSMNEFDLARSAAQRALRLDSGYLPALRTLGEIQARQARASWEQAAKIDRDDPVLRQKLGALGELLGPASSPFTQAGALFALAPPAPPGTAGAAPSASAPGAGAAPYVVRSFPVEPVSSALKGVVLAPGLEEALAALPPASSAVNSRVLVATPPGVSLRDIAASTRDLGPSGAPTFTVVSNGDHVPTGFVALPRLPVDVSAIAPPAAGSGVVMSPPPGLALAASPRGGVQKPVAPPPPVAPDVPTVATLAAAPTPPPMPAPVAVAAATPVVATAGNAAGSLAAKAEVDALLRSWATAWSRRDVPAYLAAYSAGFTGKAASRAAWERERRERIESRSSIRVELSDIDIQVTGDRAEARFRQRYESDTVKSDDRKLMQLQREGSGWRIKREAVGG